MAIGAILGLVGSGITQGFGWLNRKEARKEKALDYAFQRDEMSHEVVMGEMMLRQGQQETEQEAFLTDVKGSWQGLDRSIDNQTKSTEGTSRWVKNIVSLMRPVLTVLPLLLSLWAAVQGVQELTGMSNEATATVYGLTELTVTWWFGDRSIKRVMEHNDGDNK